MFAGLKIPRGMPSASLQGRCSARRPTLRAALDCASISAVVSFVAPDPRTLRVKGCPWCIIVYRHAWYLGASSADGSSPHAKQSLANIIHEFMIL